MQRPRCSMKLPKIRRSTRPTVRPRSMAMRGMCASGYREAEHRRRGERLAWPQLGRGEARLVRRIGKVLRLECEPVTLAIRATAGANQRPIEKVAGVKLH